MEWLKWQAINGWITCKNAYVMVDNAVLTATSRRIRDWARVRNLWYNMRRSMEQRVLRRNYKKAVKAEIKRAKGE